MRQIFLRLIIFVLISTTGVDIHLYPKKEGSIGFGIFQKLHEKQLNESPAMNIENPYLLGAEFQISWSSLEPQEGEYNWSLLDGLIRPWQELNKKIILAIFTAKKSGDEFDTATPQWVFQEGAKNIYIAADAKLKKKKGKTIKKEFSSTYWPAYWDPIYLEKYSNFIAALAKKYDGHTAIEAIEIGLGNFGSMKAVVDERLLSAYKKVGYSEGLWIQTIKKIIDVYCANFKKTPLIVRLGPLFKNQHTKYETQIKEIANYAADRGVWLYQHNLTGTDKFRQKPYARIFNELHTKTKTVLGPDNPIGASSSENDEFYGDIMQVVENGIGGVRGIPKTYISYMIFYAKDISYATKGNKDYNPQFESALKYVFDNLIQTK